MTTIRFLQSRTTLGVRDVAASIAFYRDTLGFQVQTTMGDPPQFAVLTRDAVGLGLVQADKPAVASFVGCYVNVDAVQALHRRCVEAKVTIANGLTRHPWGNYDFVLEDPDGHKLAFGEAPPGH